MKILSLVSSIFQPAADLIDSLHTSEDERLGHKAQLLNVQAAVIQTALEYESEALQAKAQIVNTEAKSEHFLTANWRPITMLTFLGLAVADALGLVEMASGRALTESAWDLLTLGVGGYVTGRSVEKVTKSIMESKVTGK